MAGLRIGFVGAGLIARYHAANLIGDPRARIEAVVDLDRDRAETFARDLCHDPARAVKDDVEQVVEAVDAVYVCTWTSAHPEVVAAAAGAGRAVFCEKPLAVDLERASAMTEAVEKAGVTNQVGLVLRHSPAFRVLRHHIADEAAGPVMNLVFRDDQYLPTQGLYGSTWRADPARAGAGTVLEHSIHDLDLIEWLLGPIVEVSARMGNVHGLAGIEDQATVTLVGASGAQASLISVWHDVLSRPSQRRVEVFTRGGYFSLEGDWSGPVRWDRSDSFEADASATGELSGPALAEEATRIDGLDTNPDQSFVSAAIEGSPAHPSFATALRAHRLADAAYRSAGTGGAWVSVD